LFLIVKIAQHGTAELGHCYTLGHRLAKPHQLFGRETHHHVTRLADIQAVSAPDERKKRGSAVFLDPRRQLAFGVVLQLTLGHQVIDRFVGFPE
jgi:hypothetical protein